MDINDEAPLLVPLEDNEEQQVVALEAENSSPLPPCPVTILSGFLGSGKTTLVQYILRSPDHGKRIAVIENEFGEGLAVESMIARDGAENSLTDLIELPNGCICCTVKDSLVATLESLLEKRKDLDYIIIECSGMANPGPIASLFWLDDALESRLQLDGIVTLVDAANIEQQLVTTVEAAQQIAFAERILLNKVDLVPDNQRLDHIEGILRGLHPTAPLRRTTYSSINDLEWVLNARCYNSDRVQQVHEALATLDHHQDHSHNHGHDCEMCTQHQHEHTSGISTISLTQAGSVDLQAVNQWLATALWPEQDEQNQVLNDLIETNPSTVEVHRSIATERQEIFRIKGVLSVVHADASTDAHVDDQNGLDQRRYIVQAVHDLWDVYPASQGLNWEAGSLRDCKLVVIGKNLKEAELRRGFEACRR